MERVKRLHVGGLAPGTTAAEVAARFKPFGEVRGEPYVREGNGFAFLDLSVTEAAFRKAMSAYNGAKWRGRALSVAEARRPDYTERLRAEREREQRLAERRASKREKRVARERRRMDPATRSNRMTKKLFPVRSTKRFATPYPHWESGVPTLWRPEAEGAGNADEENMGTENASNADDDKMKTEDEENAEEAEIAAEAKHAEEAEIADASWAANPDKSGDGTQPLFSNSLDFSRGARQVVFSFDDDDGSNDAQEPSSQISATPTPATATTTSAKAETGVSDAFTLDLWRSPQTHFFFLWGPGESANDERSHYTAFRALPNVFTHPPAVAEEAEWVEERRNLTQDFKRKQRDAIVKLKLERRKLRQAKKT